MGGRKYSVTDLTAAAAFALVLGISSYWGMSEQGNAAARQTPGLAAEAGMKGTSAGIAGGGTEADGMSGNALDGTGADGMARSGADGTGLDGMGGAWADGTGAGGMAGAGANGTGSGGINGTWADGTGARGMAGAGANGTGAGGMTGAGANGTGSGGMARSGASGTGAGGTSRTGAGANGAYGTNGNGIAGSDSTNEILILDGRQKASVAQIMAELKLGKLEEAAKIMEVREETFQELFYGTMGGERYLFDGEVFRKDINGEGLVFTKAGTVYYGTFKNGKPEGTCTALQVVNLDAPRYDYSQGLWKNGKMEGKGHTGYCYYGRIPRGEARDICKTGTFSGDMMEGGVVYTSMNGKNRTSTWKLTVKGGVAVTDDRWDYNGSTGEYLLLSENDDNHAYVLGEDQITQPMWQNLLVWDE